MKFEQIAIHVPDIDLYIQDNKNVCSLGVWKRDVVTGRVSVFGGEFGFSKAELAFNYDSDYEFELLRYLEGDNWHARKGKPLDKPFFSHKGTHIEDIDAAKNYFLNQGLVIAQEMFTETHTNDYLIMKNRRYHYVIFNSEHILGYDLKLIKRIES